MTSLKNMASLAAARDYSPQEINHFFGNIYAPNERGRINDYKRKLADSNKWIARREARRASRRNAIEKHMPRNNGGVRRLSNELRLARNAAKRRGEACSHPQHRKQILVSGAKLRARLALENWNRNRTSVAKWERFLNMHSKALGRSNKDKARFITANKAQNLYQAMFLQRHHTHMMH
jgi:hypothetical protein